MLDNPLRAECKDDVCKGCRGRYRHESVLIEVPVDLMREAQGDSVNRCCARVCESDCNDDGHQLFMEAQAEGVNQDVRRPVWSESIEVSLS